MAEQIVSTAGPIHRCVVGVFLNEVPAVGGQPVRSPDQWRHHVGHQLGSADIHRSDHGIIDPGNAGSDFPQGVEQDDACCTQAAQMSLQGEQAANGKTDQNGSVDFKRVYDMCEVAGDEFII